jgi:hypothetical protein
VNFKTEYAVRSIGNVNNNNQQFAEQLDDTGVWRSALTGKEVASMYGLGKLSGVDLSNPAVAGVAAMDTIGQSVSGVGPGSETWHYSMYVDPSHGRAYTDGGSKYIVLEGTGGASRGATTNSVVAGLAGHWSYDDSADPGHDDTGHGYQGSLLDANWVDDAQRGGALQLTGSDSMMRIAKGGTPGVDIGDSWSAAAWFKGLLPSGATWRTLFRGAGGDHQLLLRNDGHLGAYATSAGGFKDSGFDIDGPGNDEFAADAWHHLVAVGAGSQTDFYLDGIWVGDVAFKSETDIGSIGNNYYAGQRFSEYIDDAGVWQSALSPQEIAAVHGLGLFSGVDLTDGAIGAALLLDEDNTSLVGVGPEEDIWFFTDRFDTVGGVMPDLQIGLAYVADDGYEYIVLDGGAGDWVGITTRVPEPSTLLLGLVGLGLMIGRRRRR